VRETALFPKSRKYVFNSVLPHLAMELKTISANKDPRGYITVYWYKTYYYGTYWYGGLATAKSP